jgi:hypothetical protein
MVQLSKHGAMAERVDVSAQESCFLERGKQQSTDAKQVGKIFHRRGSELPHIVIVG